jgi:hypothetical protein
LPYYKPTDPVAVRAFLVLDEVFRGVWTERNGRPAAAQAARVLLEFFEPSPAGAPPRTPRRRLKLR